MRLYSRSVIAGLVCLVWLLAALCGRAGVGMMDAGVAGVAGFVPTGLPGLALWLDVCRIGPTNGTGSVGLWNDFSGAAVHATQGTGSQQPTVAAGVASGRNAVRFDGVDDFLQTANFAAALSTPMTVFLVWRSASFPSGAHVIMANSGGNNFGFHNDGTTTPRAYLMNGGVVDTYAVRVTDFTVIDVVWNGNSSRYSTNNAAFIAAAAGTTGTTLAGLVLGRVLTAYYWGGWIAEVIVYNRDLAAAEHAEVGRYLCNKYGILTR